MRWGTVDLIEVIWTLAALPGIVIWAVNLASAYRSLGPVRQAGITDGRRTVARYSVRQCWILVWLSSTFFLIGLVAMLHPPNAEAHWDWHQLIITVALIGAPVLITYIGFDWRRVERDVLRLARPAEG